MATKFALSQQSQDMHYLVDFAIKIAAWNFTGVLLYFLGTLSYSLSDKRQRGNAVSVRRSFQMPHLGRRQEASVCQLHGWRFCHYLGPAPAHCCRVRLNCSDVLHPFYAYRI